MEQNDQGFYDSIVIGSGAGGMTAALALAQAGRKVLLCEQHGKTGGWTHSFKKKGYHFNTGVHYLGELHKEGELRRIYEGLGVSEDLSFWEMNPDAYDHILIGDESFDIPKGAVHYKNRLKKRFPGETRGIERFFKKIDDIQTFSQHFSKGNWGYLLSQINVLPWFWRNGAQLVDKYLKDPLLKGIICSQIGIHGMPPNRLSAAFLAGGIIHYFNGAYHPMGGGKAISTAFMKKFKAAGGELLLKTRVKRILLEENKAIGIELEGGEMILAPIIISNADPSVTYLKLIGENYLSQKLRKKITNMKYSTSCISLFLAVDMDLKGMGMDSGNYWLYDNADMNYNYDMAYGDQAAREIPEALFVTITTLKDPSKMHKGHHQLEVFSLTGYDVFEMWAELPKGKRGAEYEQFKQDITERMLKRMERSFPGISANIVYQELGTPLTNDHYVNAPFGNVYGIEKSVKQVGPGSYAIKSEIENLYLCGASTIGHGISPSTNSGLIAAAKALGCRRRDLLKQAGPELKIYPAEDKSRWPEF